MSKVQKIANIIFVVIISATLLAVIGYETVQHAFPTLSTPQKSELEGRKYQRLPRPSIPTLANGSFQTSFSKFVADDVPLRDEIVMLNINVQRTCIELANLPLNFEAYPTFFGSDHAYYSPTGRVFKIPSTLTSDLSASIDEAAEIWNRFFERHPNIRWFLFMPDIDFISLVSPGHDLVATPLDRIYWETEFFSKLSESSTYIDGGYTDAEKWEANFFRTDHHWQIQGAFSAYQAMAKELGVTPIEAEGFFQTDSDEFWGSRARAGLCFLGPSDIVWDIAYEPSELQVRIDGEDLDATFLDIGFYYPATPYKTQAKLPDIYTGRFHTDFGLIEIENTDAETEKTLLIIGDSYTNNIERLFAENYCKVYVMDPRHFTGNIDQLIYTIQPEDALVIISAFWNDELDGTFIEAIR